MSTIKDRIFINRLSKVILTFWIYQLGCPFSTWLAFERLFSLSIYKVTGIGCDLKFLIATR